MRVTTLSLLVFALIVAIFIELHSEESSLLRADPDSLPSNPKLMAIALRRGEPLFQVHCESCHGPAGKGDPQRGVPDLTDSDWLYGTGRVADIQQTVTYGIRSYNPRGWNLAVMPAYATPQPSRSNGKILPLSPGDIRDLIELLYYQQGRSADPEATVRGSALYYGRGGCYDCHAYDIKGDSAIGAPNLSDRITLYGDGSKAALYDSIAAGRQGICPAWVGRMSAVELLEASLYTYSLSHPGHVLHDKS